MFSTEYATCFCLVFFFKQKTAYEMRISDWSSDVCSSDLRRVSHRIQESSADLMQSADQSLSNHQEVKVYGARAAEFERYSALDDRHMRLSLKVESTRSNYSAMVQLKGSTGMAMLLLMARRETMAGSQCVGGIVVRWLE